MIHYLRHNGKTLVDVEATKDDLNSVVCIDQYSMFLLAASIDDAPQIIADFDALQELRGEWFEQTPRHDKSPDALAKRRLREIGDKWGLQYVTD